MESGVAASVQVGALQKGVSALGALRQWAELIVKLTSTIVITIAAAHALMTLSDHSLWLDEAWVANTVLSGSFDATHLATLPLGFAVLVQVAARLVNEGEAVLRLWPFLFWAGGVGASALLARELYGRGLAAWLAALLVGANFTALTFAEILKPYTADMFCGTVILLTAVKAADNMRLRSWAVYGVGLGVAPLFAFGSVFDGASAALFLLVVAIRRRNTRCLRIWLASHAAVGVLLGTYALMFITPQRLSHYGTLGSSQDLLDYWSFGFPPAAGATNVLAWYAQQAMDLARFLFHQTDQFSKRDYAGAVAFLLIVVVGLMRVVRRHPERLLLLVCPFGLLVVASFLRVYPFSGFGGGRLLLGFLPLVCVLAAGGLAQVARLPQTSSLSCLAVLLTLVIPLMQAGMTLELMQDGVVLPGAILQETRPLIRSDLLTQARPGDLVYVYYGAVPAFDYYAPQWSQDTSALHGVYGEADFDGVHVVFGGSYGQKSEEYGRELLAAVAAAEPTRVWILASHVYPPSDKAALDAALERIGSSTQQWSAPGAWLYLVERGFPDGTERVGL
jgi:hypothetical protein